MTTTPYAFPELQWVQTIIFAIATLAASHFSQSTRTSLIEFALITLARKWEVCGQLAYIVYDGNQVFVFVTYQAIKIWIKINGNFDSCIIPNIGLKIRTVKTALWHLMLEEIIPGLLVEYLVSEKMLIHDLVILILNNELPF